MATRLTPLNLADEAALLFEESDRSSNISFELRIGGSFDEARLRAAVATACATHPLARARLVFGSRPFHRARWEIAPSIAPDALHLTSASTDGAMASARSRFIDRPFDLHAASPIALLLVRRPGGDSLLLSAHHALTDGVGGARLLRSVARSYAGRPDPVPPFDPVSARDLRRLPGREGSARARPASHPNRPTGPIDAIAPDRDADGDGLGFHHLSIPGDALRSPDRDRPGPGPTINDLLIAALHRTIDRWNADHGVPAGWLAVVMPCNLRPEPWRHEVVGNIMSAGRITSSPGQRESDGLLLETVTNQTRWLKDGGGTAAMLNLPLLGLGMALLSASRRLPLRGLRRRIVSSSGLSNLGLLDAEDFDFGPRAGPTLEFWFSPPSRLGLTVGAASLAGRLHLAFRYRRSLLHDGAAGRFAELFRATFVSVAAGCPAPMAGAVGLPGPSGPR